MASDRAEAKFKGEVDYFKDTEYVARCNTVCNAVCGRCGAGEVTPPMQTCAPPLIWKCIRCGRVDEADNFTIIDTDED